MSENPQNITNEDVFVASLPLFKETSYDSFENCRDLEGFPPSCDLSFPFSFEKEPVDSFFDGLAIMENSLKEFTSKPESDNKVVFSFSTEEVSKNTPDKEFSTVTHSPVVVSKQVGFEHPANETLVVRRVPQTRARSSLMGSEDTLVKEDAFSFGNRARFTKKHDRGRS
ncbi:unnamed protein product [Moneuplotes crassus]|uniref:Uncharacterized protein n=1 Tax=Euplotes crassus TaxID=5936 RepID=A0AAD1UA61_EUPCR|nr:unnamed protein product [Moneuplotes crassus]